MISRAPVVAGMFGSLVHADFLILNIITFRLYLQYMRIFLSILSAAVAVAIWLAEAREVFAGTFTLM